jgi:hypothetical protein
MKKMRFFMLLICLVILFCSCSTDSSEKRDMWYGDEVRGVSIVDEDCPVLLERETVTFDLPEFPYLGRDSAEKYLAYPGRVTTEYHFYNPTDEVLTVKLAFPLGVNPAYAAIEGEDAVSDLHKYSITLNGKAVTPELRHSTHEWYKTWTRLDVTYSSIMDEFASYHFYYPEAPVTVSTYTVSGINSEVYPDAFAVLDIPRPADGIGSLFIPDLGMDRSSSEYIRKGLVAENGMTITVYDIGVESDELPDWKIYSDHLIDEAEQITGEITLTDKRVITFRDLAMSKWSEESGVKDVDWYNAFAYLFGVRIDNYERVLDLSYKLVPWYRYEITLAPGERAVNTVTAPIYPTANTRYSPAIYTYEYIRGELNTDENYQGTEVMINTPYCRVMKEFSWLLVNYSTNTIYVDCEVTDSGYRYVPENDRNADHIVFTLSESDDPKHHSALGDLIIILMLSLAFQYVAVPIGIIIITVVVIKLIIDAVRKRRAKKQDGEGQ